MAVKRGFGLRNFLWGLVAQSCRMWNRDMIKEVKTCVIALYNMAVETKRSVYMSELWELAETAALDGIF